MSSTPVPMSGCANNRKLWLISLYTHIYAYISVCTYICIYIAADLALKKIFFLISTCSAAE